MQKDISIFPPRIRHHHFENTKKEKYVCPTCGYVAFSVIKCPICGNMLVKSVSEQHIKLMY